MKKAVIISALALLATLGIGVLVYSKIAPPAIPQKVVQEMGTQLYLPDWLPGTYAIDRDSLKMQDGKIFTFSATDADRNRLFFSEQPKQKNFDFDRFYTTQVLEPMKLQGVPFPSVYARAPFGKTWILSIVTDKTWIMMTTDSPVDSVMAQKIVQEMKNY